MFQVRPNLKMYQAMARPKLVAHWVNVAYWKALGTRIWNLVSDSLYHYRLGRERPKRGRVKAFKLRDIGSGEKSKFDFFS